MWYAMQIMSGSEALVAQLCRRTIDQNLLKQCFYPQYESSHKIHGVRRVVTKILFPGYLFLDTENIEEVEKQLHKIPELTKVLKVGRTCIPLEREEQEFIQKHSNEDFIFTMSKGYMTAGYVHIEEGAFAGYYGKLLYVDRHNRYGIMEVKIIGRTVEMQFGLEIVQKET